MAALVSQPEDTDIQRAFLQLVKLALYQGQGLDLQIENITKLSKIQQMLSTRLDQWEEETQKKGFKRGIEKDREESRAEGKQFGESTLLYLQLERRYGPFPA